MHVRGTNFSISLIFISLIVDLTSCCFADPALRARQKKLFLRPGSRENGPAPSGDLRYASELTSGEKYSGYAARNKVVGLVASTVQDFYARLIQSFYADSVDGGRRSEQMLRRVDRSYVD